MRSKIVQQILNETPKDIEIFVDLYADLVVRINRLIKEKGITRKELARKLDKQPSEISKWLSGKHNFTLRSIAKLQAELGEPLLAVPKSKAQKDFSDGYEKTVHTFISYRKIEKPDKPKVVDWKPAKTTKKLRNVG